MCNLTRRAKLGGMTLIENPRSRIPTLAEMHDWYVSIQTPEAARLRFEIDNQTPTPRVILAADARNRPWRATPHASLDGATPLCGRSLAHPEVQDSRFVSVSCKRCLATLDELGLDVE